MWQRVFDVIDAKIAAATKPTQANVANANRLYYEFMEDFEPEMFPDAPIALGDETEKSGDPDADRMMK